MTFLPPTMMVLPPLHLVLNKLHLLPTVWSNASQPLMLAGGMFKRNKPNEVNNLPEERLLQVGVLFSPIRMLLPC